MALTCHSGTCGDGRSPGVVADLRFGYVSLSLVLWIDTSLLPAVTPTPTFPILSNYMTPRNNEWFTDKPAALVENIYTILPGKPRLQNTPGFWVKNLAEMHDPPP